MHRSRRRVILGSIAAAALLVAAAFAFVPASASVSTQVQTAQDTLANCKLLVARSSGTQRIRAQECVIDQTAIIELLTGPVPTTPPDAPSTAPTTPGPTATAPTATVGPQGPTPNPQNTGPPAGWQPTTTRTGDWTITTPGTYTDIKVNGSILVRAVGVTLRRVQVAGGTIWNEGDGRCYNNLLLDQVSVTPQDGQTYSNGGVDGAIGPAGYTARKVKIYNRVEGFRVGAKSSTCTTVTIEDSYVGINPDPSWCQAQDWHGDGLQGYYGPALVMRNNAFDYVTHGCSTTAPFFYPSGQGNTSVDIDGLLINAPGFGGYAFRLGTPGSVRGLHIVSGSWGYGPIDVNCSAVTEWDASIVNVGGDLQLPVIVRAQPCNTPQGGA